MQKMGGVASPVTREFIIDIAGDLPTILLAIMKTYIHGGDFEPAFNKS